MRPSAILSFLISSMCAAACTSAQKPVRILVISDPVCCHAMIDTEDGSLADGTTPLEINVNPGTKLDISCSYDGYEGQYTVFTVREKHTVSFILIKETDGDGDLVAKSIVQRESGRAQVFAILTDEQKAKAAEMRSKFEERGKGHKGFGGKHSGSEF